MRRRHRHPPPSELNLVPMLDVLMTVLTFFIIISMTLTMEKNVEVQLPGNPDQNAPQPDAPDPLLVKLTLQGLVINDQPVSQSQALQQVKTYLATTPKGVAVLQSDAEVRYDKVVNTLSELKSVGGDRVSIGLE